MKQTAFRPRCKRFWRRSFQILNCFLLCQSIKRLCQAVLAHRKTTSGFWLAQQENLFQLRLRAKFQSLSGLLFKSGAQNPADLAGVSAATFEPHSSGKLQSALGAAATLIEEQVARLGLRDRERLKQLSEAAHGFDTAAVQMHKLVELIARSRKVELGIVGYPLFAAFLSPEQLKQIERDNADL